MLFAVIVMPGNLPQITA